MKPDDDLQRQINDLRSGDPKRRDKVLRQLYEHPMVAAKVRSWNEQYAGGRLGTADIIQDSVLLLFQHVRDGKFRGDSKLTTYLLKICQNNIRNGGRQKRLRVTDSLDGPEHESYSPPGEKQDTDLERKEATEHLELRNRLLRQVLSQLTENCQSALALYYTKNKNTREIAELKEYASPQQAKTLLHRCRERLRKLISDDSDLHDFLKMTR